MRLKLHVGTEKTGSSYLQTLCAKNRQFLRENGLWFPDAGKYERQLQRGTVSPGNGLDLGQHIRGGAWASVSAWLTERVTEAEQRECRTLLLSYELLFADMSNEGAVDKFQSAAKEAGIGEISCLLMIRDPVDQVLSLYKHRAKKGRVGDIGEWIKQGYPLPRQLQDFLVQIDRSKIQMHLRKYLKDTDYLIDVFFHDWLEVNDPPVKIRSYLNPSLSLSELAVIRHIVSIRPGDQRAFYSKFLALSRDQKADEQEIETATAAKVENYLCRFNDVWEFLDARLASDGGIEIPRIRQSSVKDAQKYSFSEAQIKAWSEAHRQSATIRYAVNTLIHRLGIGMLVRNVATRFRSGLRSLFE